MTYIVSSGTLNPTIPYYTIVLLYCIKCLCIFGLKGCIQIRYYYYYIVNVTDFDSCEMSGIFTKSQRNVTEVSEKKSCQGKVA